MLHVRITLISCSTSRTTSYYFSTIKASSIFSKYMKYHFNFKILTWFRIQGPLRSKINLGEESAAYGHSWSVGRNSMSDGIIGNLEKLKMKQNNQKNLDNLVIGWSSREKSLSGNSVLIVKKSQWKLWKVFGQFREIICMFSIFLYKWWASVIVGRY